MEAGELEFAKPAHREFAEQGGGSSLMKFLKESSPSDKEIALIQSHLLEKGTDAEVETILIALTTGNGLKSPAAAIGMLETLEQMARPEPPRSLRRGFRSLKKLVDDDNETIAVLAAANLGAWGATGRAQIAALQDDSYSLAVKQALAVALAKTNSARYEKTLAKLAADGGLETRYAATAGLSQVELTRGVKALAKLLAEDPQGIDPTPIVRAVLQHRQGAQLLSDELQKIKIHPAVMASVSKFHRESGLLPDNLAAMFRPPSTTGSLSAKLLAEDIDTLSAEVEKHGDPAKGELAYRLKATACTSCHAIGSAGASIGPNLVAVGAAADTKYLVQSILEPNAAIAEHYETRTFVLTNGKVQTGIITFRNENEVVLRDSAQIGKEIRIAAEDIKEEIPMPSLMPAGLADQLQSREEFLDLVKFLSLLGKPGEYANDESPVIRKWRVISASKSDGLPDDKASWLPAYSKVSGELPPEDYPAGETIYARGFVNVLVAGSVRLKINSNAGLKLWVDGKPIEDLAAPIKLEKGRRALTFGFDPEKRKNGLRVELEVIDDQAKFQPEGGL